MPRSSRKPAPMKVKKPVPVPKENMFEADRPLQFSVMEDIAKDKKVKEKDVFEMKGSRGVKGVHTGTKKGSTKKGRTGTKR